MKFPYQKQVKQYILYIMSLLRTINQNFVCE